MLMAANSMIHWHALPVDAVLESIGSHRHQGITSTEAANRLAEHGFNELPEEAHKPMWKVFAAQFASPLIYILFVAAIISFAMGHASDAAVILVVVKPF